jgi:hypothetical protein
MGLFDRDGKAVEVGNFYSGCSSALPPHFPRFCNVVAMGDFSLTLSTPYGPTNSVSPDPASGKPSLSGLQELASKFTLTTPETILEGDEPEVVKRWVRERVALSRPSCTPDPTVGVGALSHFADGIGHAGVGK